MICKIENQYYVRIDPDNNLYQNFSNCEIELYKTIPRATTLTLESFGSTLKNVSDLSKCM